MVLILKIIICGLDNGVQYRTSLQVRIQDGKFWIEEDGLEEGVATDLLEAGVLKEDIVLAFHHPKMRPYTEFAVA